MGFQSMFRGILLIVPHVTTIKTNSAVSSKENHTSAITNTTSFQFESITFLYMKIGRKGYFAVASIVTTLGFLNNSFDSVCFYFRIVTVR